MTHKAHTSKIFIGLMIFWLILTLFYVGGCTYFCVTAIIADDVTKAFLWIFMLTCFLVISFLICIGTNRTCCIIEYNEETREINRKGRFRGFEHNVKVENIKDVLLVYIYRSGFYIEIIEKENENYNKISKKHPIRLELNKQNAKFVRLFWDKPITQKMIHGKLMEISDYDKRHFGL